MGMISMEFDEGSGWSSEITFSPIAGDEAANNYGTLRGRYNKNLKLATIWWNGNSAQPAARQYKFNMSSEFIPASSCATGMKGDTYNFIQASYGLSVAIVQLGATAWSAGTLTYVTL